MRCCGRPFVFSRSKEKSTSAAVIGAAVRKMRARIEVEGHMRPRGVDVDRLRDEAVEREGLVLRARHQALKDIADEALRGRPRLQIEGIEAVEGSGEADAKPSALFRARVRRKGNDRSRAAGRARHASRSRGSASGARRRRKEAPLPSPRPLRPGRAPMPGYTLGGQSRRSLAPSQGARRRARIE